MLDINFLKNSWFFSEKVLEKWDTLFVEWDVDNNIYIVLLWELSVEKYTSKNKTETKILAYLKQNDIFGEAALSSSSEKQVNIVASKKTSLIYINAVEWLNKFTQKHLNEGFNLLKYIIYLSNNRLLESNYLITSTYKISKEITELEEVTNKSIFDIIEKLKNSLKVDDVLYYEINPVVPDYITLKYDTRKSWKMLNGVTDIADNELELLSYRSEWYFTFRQILAIWSKSIWYLVFLKKDKKFNDSDKKVFTTTSSAIAGLIRQKQLMDEDRDREFMSED